MIPIVPAQLTDIQRAVQDHFQRGGSTVTALAVIGAIAAAVTLAYLLTRRQERTRGQVAINDPAALFRTLIGQLKLTGSQRRLLVQAARSADLPHPTVLLLSTKAFDRHVGDPSKQRHGASAPSEVNALREALFRSPTGIGP